MSDFKVKMHQIRFQLQLRPRPRWVSLQRSLDTLVGFKGAYFSREKRERKGREKKERGERKGEGREE